MAVRVRLHWCIRAFMAVWYGLLSVAALATLGELPVNGRRWMLPAPAAFQGLGELYRLLPSGGPGEGYALCCLGRGGWNLDDFGGEGGGLWRCTPSAICTWDWA